MVADAEAGYKQAVLEPGNAYVDDRMTAVTGGLDHIDPSVVHV
jgi:hypothetical protein